MSAPIPDQINLALFILRITLGLFMAMHGYRKLFGPGGINGTIGWFGSIVMKPAKANAYMAALTEIGAGLLVAFGLLTPLAAAGLIGLMVVAIVVAHRKNGFFIFNPGQGWEYCATIGLAALSLGTLGAGEWSLDNAFDLLDNFDGWTGFWISLIAGVGGAIVQLAACYRPARSS